jgi:hypothetical protein
MARPRYMLPIGIATLYFLVVGLVELRPSLTVAAQESKHLLRSELVPGQDVTALFNVEIPAGGTSDGGNVPGAKEWDIYSRTQLAILKSVVILRKAVDDDSVRNLPLVKAQRDVVGWLAQELQVGFIQNSSIMYVRLRGAPSEADELRKIVDAVANAYLRELEDQLQEQVQSKQEVIMRRLDRLTKEIRTKAEIHKAIANDLGNAAHDEGAKLLQSLDLRRLEQVDAEILRLEAEQLAAEIYAKQEQAQLSAKERAMLPFYEQWLDQLQKRRDELEERILARTQASIELELQQKELRQLQKSASTLSAKLESIATEAGAQPRTRLIHRAQ